MRGRIYEGIIKKLLSTDRPTDRPSVHATKYVMDLDFSTFIIILLFYLRIRTAEVMSFLITSLRMRFASDKEEKSFVSSIFYYNSTVVQSMTRFEIFVDFPPSFTIGCKYSFLRFDVQYKNSGGD